MGRGRGSTPEITKLTVPEEKLFEFHRYKLCLGLSYVTLFSFKNSTPILQMAKLRSTKVKQLAKVQVNNNETLYGSLYFYVEKLCTLTIYLSIAF